MAFLVFQLKAPLASFGVLSGEVRPTELRPRRSAVTGLLAAAKGIRRDEDERFSQLGRSFRMACAVLRDPTVLSDFHTIEAPGQRLGTTRRQQLQFSHAVGKQSNTVVTRRDYLQDGRWLIALHGAAEALEDLKQALERPAFTLYLGRKSCALSAFTAPAILEASSVEAALSDWLAQFSTSLQVPVVDVATLLWEPGVPCELALLLERRRLDNRTRLSVNTFGGRTEYEATLKFKVR